MEKYRELIKQLAEIYAADIRQKSKTYQKLVAFEIMEDISCSLSEKRMSEASKQYREKTNPNSI